ncbi:MAG: TerC family protein [Rickettsiales bacterium]|jgi:predicted tellurium resistance membrane protein TerC|nr:TerC family protein [Rickettsiales bacterium]
MEFLTDYQIWTSLISLTALEIILGVDNVIFIALVVAHLPEHERHRARVIGLMLALIMRIGLLFAVVWIISLKEPWLYILGGAFSGKDLMMLGGGLFLLAKATIEIHGEVAVGEEKTNSHQFQGAFAKTIIQIIFIDFIFSFDSVITAVGVSSYVGVIIVAMTIAMFVMLFLSKAISDFITHHPAIKILALAFIMLIGVLLIAEGLGMHFPKGYIYFAMAFSLSIEMLNMKIRKRESRG